MKNSTSQALGITGRKFQRLFKTAKRSFEIFDQNLQVGAVERHPAGKGFADQLIGDRHVGDDDILVTFLDPLAHGERLAQRDEFRIVLDIGDKIEHVAGGVASRAWSWRVADSGMVHARRRCALSRAKSSPA